MQDLLAQLMTLAKGMWRFRWHGLIFAWLVGVVCAVMVLRIPDRYEANARVYVDTQSILRPLMSGLAIQPNVNQQLAMLSRTLISRPNVEKLVRMADLDLKAESKPQQDALVGDVMSMLEIKDMGRDNLYLLSYRDSDPARAQRVIQSLVSIFVESSLGATRKDTATAKTFIDDQIKTYEAKLQEAETRLKQFQLKNIDLQVGEGRDTASRLSGLGEQLQQARLELREAESARDSAKTQMNSQRGQRSILGGGSGIDDPSVGGNTPEVDARIDAQKSNLDLLLLRFTEQHPEVIGTRRLIAQLEAQKKKQIEDMRKAALAAPAASAGDDDSFAAQQMSSMLASYEVQIAGLRARVAEYSTRYQNALDAMKTAPQIEAESARLNRDYGINKKNYEDLVARREAAAMSGELEAAAGVADFRLIDPPRVTPQPVWPNRPMLLLAAFGATVLSGLALSFLLNQLRPVFNSASEMRTQLEIPVLGVVSRVTSPANRRRARIDLTRFLVGSGSLAAAFLTILIVVAVTAARRMS